MMDGKGEVEVGGMGRKEGVIVMPGVSGKTKVVGVRLPVDVAEKVEVLAGRRGITVSSYLAKLVALQVTRKR